MTETAFELSEHIPQMARFAIVMAVLLVVPLYCKRFRIPSVVGLMLCGLALGPSGIHFFPKEPHVVEFFGELGKLMLMFFAGLEIDLDDFLKSRTRCLVFGLLTFALPLGAGLWLASASGYSLLAAILIGSLIASHTLLAYPAVKEAGLGGSRAVTVTLGATLITDMLALVTLAICISIFQTGFSPAATGFQLLELSLFIPAVLFGGGWLGRKAMLRYGHSTESQFVLMLFIIGFVAWASELIHLEAIIGAFLAGLAVSRAVRQSRARENLEFLGNSLFIPLFFLTLGFIIDIPVFFQTLRENLPFVAGIVLALFAGKYLAALGYSLICRAPLHEVPLIASLSLPQVAATLAAALVGYQTLNAQGERLLDQAVVNTIIVLMLLTSVVGPVLTGRYLHKYAKNQ
jgi:Kef-type K+ transport system membrane component KefB